MVMSYQSGIYITWEIDLVTYTTHSRTLATPRRWRCIECIGRATSAHAAPRDEAVGEQPAAGAGASAQPGDRSTFPVHLPI